MNATENLLRLIDFAVAHGLVEDIDRDYTLNRLLDVMKLDAPEEARPCGEPLPPTVTPMLTELAALATQKGL
ncbi:MAG: galactose-1-phosphate uridylyltransferase, partial [Clostridia bacterium]|nr:galactose-1-phosphate uridylyltransferase [Clostridia bacterium]